MKPHHQYSAEEKSTFRRDMYKLSDGMVAIQRDCPQELKVEFDKLRVAYDSFRKVADTTLRWD